MKKTTLFTICYATVAFALGGNRAQGAEGPPNKPPKYPKILKQPQSRISEEATYAEFAVSVDNQDNPVNYSWQVNDGKTNATFVDIPGATNKSYWIDHVQFTNVASYRVFVSCSETNLFSDTAHLSVFRVYHTNSTAGTLQTPILAFVSSNDTIDGFNYLHFYTPPDELGNPALFYGRHASPQYSPFVNWNYGSLLDADTISSENAPSRTALRIRNNFGLGSILCVHGTPLGGAGAQCGSITLSTGAGDPSHNNTYRFGLWYGDPAPATGKVTYNWHYHD